MARNEQNNKLKVLVKSAISELVEENQELIQQIIEEAVEQAFMTRAIRIGRQTKKVPRNRIFDAMSRQEA